MKIAVNTRLLLKDKMEGLGWYMHEVLKLMVEQHPEHEFIFLFDRPFDPSFVYGPNVKPVVLFPPARHPLLFVWWFEWSVARALSRIKPDVFLTMDNFAVLRTEVKTVLVTHDLAHYHYPHQLTWVQRLYYQTFVPHFNKKATRIVTVSEFTRQDIISSYNIEPERISVSYNGCKKGFKPLAGGEIKHVREKYAKGKPYFLYVGAIHPRKNVHRLLQAFARFKNATQSNAKILIVGRFAWKSGYAKEALKDLTYQPDIRFLGYVEYEELCSITGAALCAVNISLIEGFGVPLLEAMHSEIPIIASNTTALGEIAGEAALLVNPESVEETALAMQKIWEDADLRLKLVNNGRHRREKFSWGNASEIVYENLERAYKSVT